MSSTSAKRSPCPATKGRFATIGAHAQGPIHDSLRMPPTRHELSPMTGNTIRFGNAVSHGLWDDAGLARLIIFCVYLGGLEMLALLDLGQRSAAVTTVGPALLLGGALLLSDGLAFALESSVSFERLRLVTALTAFSFGRQNVVTNKAPCLGASTTFLTGTA